MRADGRGATVFSFGGMNPTPTSDHFPMTKGAMVMTAMVLFFSLLILMVYLWYDLRLQQMQQTSSRSPMHTELHLMNPEH